MPLHAGMEKTFPYKLSLDEVKQGTDTRGVLNFEVIMKLSITDKIQFTLPSGQKMFGVVKTLEVSETERSLRIYGEILNSKDGKFGFVFTSQGDIAGAIILKDEDKTYVVRPNNLVQGYTFNLEYPKSTTN